MSIDKLGLLVSARLDSRRLPGKSLMDIGSRPLLGHVLDRVRRVEEEMTIVVATTDRRSDDPIADFASVEGVEVFRGETDDVRQRLISCAEEYDFQSIVRINGDSPFIDPTVIDTLVRKHFKTCAQFTTNVIDRTFPAGVSVEVIKRQFLERLARDYDAPHYREHVTPQIYTHPEEFDITEVRATDPRYNGLELSVDDPIGLERARRIVALLGPGCSDATLDEIVTAALSIDGCNFETRETNR